MDGTVTFAIVTGNFRTALETSDVLDIDVECVADDGFLFGTYTYESETRFGSNQSSVNDFVLSPNGVLGIVTTSDHPKPEHIFREVNESVDGLSIAPVQYTSETSRNLFQEYGVGVSSFSDSLPDLSLGRSSGSHYDPEETAKEIAMSQPKTTISDDLVQETIEQFFEDELFVSSMSLSLDCFEYSIPFSAPARFSRVPGAGDGLERSVARRLVALVSNLEQDSV